MSITKVIGLSVAALSASSFAFLLHAEPPASGQALRVDITSPADRAGQRWQAQVPYEVTVSYDGKSTKFGELPANDVVLQAAYAANAATAKGGGAVPQALVDISQSNCMGCHDFEANAAAPSFAAIGKRYAHQADAAALLAGHIRNGESGAWGMGAMPRHPGMSAEQATGIAQWIVTHGSDPALHYSIGKSGSFRMTAPGRPAPHAGMVLTAFYTGPLKPGDTRRPAAGRSTIVVPGAP